MTGDLKIAPTFGDIMLEREQARIGNQWAEQQIMEQTLREFQKLISGVQHDAA